MVAHEERDEMIMRYLHVLCSATILLSGSLRSQSLDSARAYYPLAIGDIWQYAYADLWINPPAYESFQTRSISSDTVLQNALRYFVISTKGSPIKTYLRMDSATATVYSWNGTTDVTAESLQARPGDHVGSLICSAGSQSVFGDTIPVKSFMVPGGGYTLGYGFGMVSTYDESFGLPRGDILLYARIDGKEYGTMLSVTDARSVPIHFTLNQNFPNPFNPATKIKYSIEKSDFVMLRVFDGLGREISTLVNQLEPPGDHEAIFDGKGLATGIYRYRLTVGNESLSKQMILLK